MESGIPYLLASTSPNWAEALTNRDPMPENVPTALITEPTVLFALLAAILGTIFWLSIFDTTYTSGKVGLYAGIDGSIECDESGEFFSEFYD